MKVLWFLRVAVAVVFIVLAVNSAYFAINFVILAPLPAQKVVGGIFFGVLALCLLAAVIEVTPKDDP